MAEKRPEDSAWDPSIVLDELETLVEAVAVRYAGNPLRRELIRATEALLDCVSAICQKAEAMDAPRNRELYQALGLGLAYLARVLCTERDTEVMSERIGKVVDRPAGHLVFLLNRLKSDELIVCTCVSHLLYSSDEQGIANLRATIIIGGVCAATRQNREEIFTRTVEQLSIYAASLIGLVDEPALVGMSNDYFALVLHRGWNAEQFAWFLGAVWVDLAKKLGVEAFDRAVDRLRAALMDLSATIQGTDTDVDRLMAITQSMLDERPKPNQG